MSIESSLEAIKACRKAFSLQFRRDVVTVARKCEAPSAQVAKEFGVFEACLHRWLKLADVEDGARRSPTRAATEEIREVKRRNRLLKQENEVLRRAAAYLSRDINPKCCTGTRPSPSSPSQRRRTRSRST